MFLDIVSDRPQLAARQAACRQPLPDPRVASQQVNGKRESQSLGIQPVVAVLNFQFGFQRPAEVLEPWIFDLELWFKRELIRAKSNAFGGRVQERVVDADAQ